MQTLVELTIFLSGYVLATLNCVDYFYHNADLQKIKAYRLKLYIKQTKNIQHLFNKSKKLSYRYALSKRLYQLENKISELKEK